MTEAELNAAITAFRLETEDLIPAVNLKYYFNGGLPNYRPYTDTAEALSVIGANWKPYMAVNVDGVDYWFLPDGSLVNKTGSLSLLDESVTLAKMADIAGLSVIGNPTKDAGTPQVILISALKTLLGIIDHTTDISGKVDKITGSSLITDTLKSFIHAPGSDNQDLTAINSAISELYNLIGVPPQRLLLPASYEVSGRITGATLDTGITSIAAVDGTDLKITHTLTGRKIVAVNVFSTNTGVDRWLPSGSIGYAGFTGDATTVTIEGLTNIDLPLRIELIFS